MTFHFGREISEEKKEQEILELNAPSQLCSVLFIGLGHYMFERCKFECCFGAFLVDRKSGHHMVSFLGRNK